MNDSTTTINAPANASLDVNALIKKHRVEIDHFKALDSAGQKEALRALGVDPEALERYYQSFIDRSAELKREDAEADKKTAVTGVLSSLATGAVAFLKRKAISPVKFVQASAVIFSSVAAGIAGTFAGSRIFAGDIREKSKQLTIEAKDAFEREVAVALENREREKATDTAGNAASKVAASVAPRDASFAVQAAAEKALTSAELSKSF